MQFNIGDVARLANVSKATVSAVLNERPGVSSRTREKVLEIVKKLNYKPNPVARSLTLRATKSIGLVIKEIDNPYFAKVMRGVFDACSKNGYTVLLGSSEESPEKESQSVEALSNQRVDGLILSPLQAPGSDFSYLANLLTRNYPLVTLGEIRNYSTNVVDIDNVRSAFEAVSYLINSGHDKIAYFAGPSFSAHSQDRLEGYRRAHAESQTPIDPRYVVECGAYFQNGYAEGKKVFSEDRFPTAVFCYNDLVALGIIEALTELGFRVPEDVAVIGFDDIDFSRYAKIPLTTVHVPAYDIGVEAANLLIGQLNTTSPAKPEKRLLPAHLVKPRST